MKEPCRYDLVSGPRLIIFIPPLLIYYLITLLLSYYINVIKTFVVPLKLALGSD